MLFLNEENQSTFPYTAEVSIISHQATEKSVAAVTDAMAFLFPSKSMLQLQLIWSKQPDINPDDIEGVQERDEYT